jgi:hypothetical protein
MIRLTSWKLWLVAGGLIVIDLWLLGVMLFKPVKVANSDQSQWDFRIAELRQLEASSGQYVVTTRTDASVRRPTQTGTWLRYYFPGQEAQLGTATMSGWPPVLSRQPVAKDVANQADSKGQIL